MRQERNAHEGCCEEEEEEEEEGRNCCFGIGTESLIEIKREEREEEKDWALSFFYIQTKSAFCVWEG